MLCQTSHPIPSDHVGSVRMGCTGNPGQTQAGERATSNEQFLSPLLLNRVPDAPVIGSRRTTNDEPGTPRRSTRRPWTTKKRATEAAHGVGVQGLTRRKTQRGGAAANTRALRGVSASVTATSGGVRVGSELRTHVYRETGDREESPFPAVFGVATRIDLGRPPVAFVPTRTQLRAESTQVVAVYNGCSG